MEEQQDTQTPNAERRAHALAELGLVVYAILDALWTIVLMSLPMLAQLGCACVGIVGAYMVGERAWSAFGGDPAAFIPAVMFAVLPLGFAIRLGFGGMLGAGVFSIAMSYVLPALPLVVRDSSIVGMIAAVVVIYLRSTRREKEQ